MREGCSTFKGFFGPIALAVLLTPVSTGLHAQEPQDSPEIQIPDAAAAHPADTGEDRIAAPDDAQRSRLQQLQSALAEAPTDPELRAERDRLLQQWLDSANAFGETGRLDEMAEALALIEAADPDFEGLNAARGNLASLRRVQGWMERAEQALGDGRLIEPPGDNAQFFLDKVLDEQPGDQHALRQLLVIQARLIERAMKAAEGLDFELANEWLAEAAALQVDTTRVEQARIEITSLKWRQANQVETQIDDFLAQGEFNRAEILLIDLVALGVRQDRIAELRDRIEQARTYGAFDPNEVFRDGILGTNEQAPPMVVVPAGSFLMGAADQESMASEDQKPRHRITISRGFALGLNEVSVAEFRTFVRVTHYRTEAEVEGHSKVYDERTGRLMQKEGINWRHDYAGQNAGDRLPVLHVTWHDAQAYVSWLANATGKPYRLPTEAEFEYALRAGSMSPYWWGNDTPPDRLENLTGDQDSSPKGRNWSIAFANYSDGHWGPAPVASFPANPFGLHDMAGNVSEWVMDCWHANYLRAPLDGSAWVNPGCERRVIRGGYWASSPAQARSAARLYAEAHLRGPRVGFRIARDL